MKRSALLVGVCAVALGLASIAPDARAADCAVGGFVVNKRTGIIEQLLAFTTNATFFITYAGAITTGTSGCSNSGLVKQEYEQQIFVTANFDALAGDLAQGQGPQLAALTELMGCSPQLGSELAHVAQAHFDRLVTGGPEQANALLTELKQEMRVHPALSRCTRLA